MEPDKGRFRLFRHCEVFQPHPPSPPLSGLAATSGLLAAGVMVVALAATAAGLPMGVPFHDDCATSPRDPGSWIRSMDCRRGQHQAFLTTRTAWIPSAFRIEAPE